MWQISVVPASIHHPRKKQIRFWDTSRVNDLLCQSDQRRPRRSEINSEAESDYKNRFPSFPWWLAIVSRTLVCPIPGEFPVDGNQFIKITVMSSWTNLVWIEIQSRLCFISTLYRLKLASWQIGFKFCANLFVSGVEFDIDRNFTVCSKSGTSCVSTWRPTWQSLMRHSVNLVRNGKSSCSKPALVHTKNPVHLCQMKMNNNNTLKHSLCACCTNTYLNNSKPPLKIQYQKSCCIERSWSRALATNPIFSGTWTFHSL